VLENVIGNPLERQRAIASDFQGTSTLTGDRICGLMPAGIPSYAGAHWLWTFPNRRT
jgi:hypothetical protein